MRSALLLAAIIGGVGSASGSGQPSGENFAAFDSPIAAPPSTEGKPRTESEPRTETESRLDEAVEPAGFFSSVLSHGDPAAEPAEAVVNLFGHIQADALYFSQDAESEALLGDLQDAVDFRRLRLGARGTVGEQFGYFLLLDFALSGRPGFIDVWGELRDQPIGTIRVGRFRTPMGLEPLSPIPEVAMLERPSVTLLVPFRQTGINVQRLFYDDNVLWAIAGYRFPSNPFGTVVGDAGYGMATRLTSVLWETEDSLWHAGASYSHNSAAENVVRFRASPAIGVPAVDLQSPPFIPNFVDTGPIRADSDDRFGGELAWLAGPLTLQTEAVVAQVYREQASSAAFASAYVQAAYVLTGERRMYNRQEAFIHAPVPDRPFGQGGAGAWEVAARWDWIDLNSGPVRGGELGNAVLGINWYLNRFVRLQFNYIRAWLDRDGIENAATDVFGLRGQIVF